MTVEDSILTLPNYIDEADRQRQLQELSKRSIYVKEQSNAIQDKVQELKAEVKQAINTGKDIPNSRLIDMNIEIKRLEHDADILQFRQRLIVSRIDELRIHKNKDIDKNS